MIDRKPFVFVLMPFNEQFHDVYEVGIKLACKESGAYCERVDEQIFEENILDRIYNQIEKADLVVADMSDRNANVYYEVGFAHALNKRVILITNNEQDIPFDLKHYPHIIYDSRISYLKKELEKKLKHFINHSKPSRARAANKIRIWSDRDSVEPSFRQRILQAEKSLFLIGFSFETLFKNHSKALVYALEKGVIVRILMLHPESEHVNAHQEFSSRKVKASIVKVIEEHMRTFYELYEVLDPSTRGNLEIRLTYYAPRFAARIYDEENMLLNFYLYKSKAHENPTLEINRNTHKAEFQAILNSMNALFNYEARKEGSHPNYEVVSRGEWIGLPMHLKGD